MGPCTHVLLNKPMTHLDTCTCNYILTSDRVVAWSWGGDRKPYFSLEGVLSPPMLLPSSLNWCCRDSQTVLLLIYIGFINTRVSTELLLYHAGAETVLTLWMFQSIWLCHIFLPYQILLSLAWHCRGESSHTDHHTLHTTSQDLSPEPRTLFDSPEIK